MMKKNLMCRNSEKGFVLLEVAISLGIFSFIILSSILLISNLLLVSNKILVGQDKLENLRIGQYFFCEQIRNSDKVDVKVSKDFSLKDIRLYYLDADKKELVEGHTFKFKGNEIKFGGVDDKDIAYNNSLSQNISDVKFWYDEQLTLMYIKITTDNFPPLYFVMFVPDKQIDIKTN